jgi:hypothetical protein
LKFKNITDIQLFLIETNQISILDSVSESYTPSKDCVNEFLKRRKDSIGKLKDFRKSQDAKQSWRANRYKIMNGIKQFHKSTEGKRFHRNLGRFVASRISRNESKDYELLVEALKAISSIPTHILIETEYFQPSIEDQLSLDLIVDQYIPELYNIVEKIIKDANLNEQDIDLLVRFVPQDILVESLESLSVSKEDAMKLIQTSLGDINGN